MIDECWDCYYWSCTGSMCKKHNKKVNGSDEVCDDFLLEEMLTCGLCVYSREDNGNYQCEKKDKIVKKGDSSCECFLMGSM